MSEVNYGVKDNEVILGDGRTGVQSFVFEDGTAGVVFCRDGRHSEPFGKFLAGENDTIIDGVNPIIAVRADNEKSIQVVIDRLEEAKLMMRGKAK